MAFQGRLRSRLGGETREEISGNFGLPVDKSGEEAEASFSALGCAGEPRVSPTPGSKRTQQSPVSHEPSLRHDRPKQPNL